MRLYCFHCDRLIRVDNDLRYVCPHCHAVTTVTPGRGYGSMSNEERDDYWKSKKLQAESDRISAQTLLLRIFICTGIVGIIAAVIFSYCCGTPIVQ